MSIADKVEKDYVEAYKNKEKELTMKHLQLRFDVLLLGS